MKRDLGYWDPCTLTLEVRSSNFLSISLLCVISKGRRRPPCMPVPIYEHICVKHLISQQINNATWGTWIASSPRSKLPREYRYSISANRELVALGAGNIVSSFIPGSLPAFGSLTRYPLCFSSFAHYSLSTCRTKLNGDVGAKTQMSSLIVAIVVLLVTFFMLPWLYYLPKAILASV